MNRDDVNNLILAQYPDGYDADELVEIDPSRSIGSCRHWKVESSAGTFCLRRWPKNELRLERLQFIQAVLWHADCEGIDFVPLPLETVEHQGFADFDNAYWELLPWFDDTENGSENSLNDEIPLRLNVKPFRIVSAMLSLAQFHLATSSFPLPDFPMSISPGIRANLSYWEQWIGGRLPQLTRRLQEVVLEREEATTLTWRHSVARKGLGLIDRLIPHTGNEMILLTRGARLSVPIQPVIGNACLRHLRFDPDGVCGIIDFKELAVDGVARDIASLLGSMAEADASLWTLGLQAYQSLRPLSDNELYMVKAFDLSQLFLEGLGYLSSVFVQREEYSSPQLQEIARRLDRMIFRLDNEFPLRKTA